MPVYQEHGPQLDYHPVLIVMLVFMKIRTDQFLVKNVPETR